MASTPDSCLNRNLVKKTHQFYQLTSIHVVQNERCKLGDFSTDFTLRGNRNEAIRLLNAIKDITRSLESQFIYFSGHFTPSRRYDFSDSIFLNCNLKPGSLRCLSIPICCHSVQSFQSSCLQHDPFSRHLHNSCPIQLSSARPIQSSSAQPFYTLMHKTFTLRVTDVTN